MNKITLHGFIDYIDRRGIGSLEKTASVGAGPLFRLLIKLAASPKALALRAALSKGTKALTGRLAKAQKAKPIQRAKQVMKSTAREGAFADLASKARKSGGEAGKAIADSQKKYRARMLKATTK